MSTLKADAYGSSKPGQGAKSIRAKVDAMDFEQFKAGGSAGARVSNFRVAAPRVFPSDCVQRCATRV